MCCFVAPSVFADSAKQIDYVMHTENLFIRPQTIAEFVGFPERNRVLYSAA